MIRKWPILIILYICIALSIHAVEVHFYSSNTIGQKLFELEGAPPFPSGYYVKIDENNTLRKSLYFDNQLLWIEQRVNEGVHTYIDRKDGEGNLLIETHHINNQISTMSQLVDGSYQNETYLYDSKGQLYSIVRESDGIIKKSFFFVNAQGRLEGLMVYQEDLDHKQSLDHTLIFSIEQNTFAIGSNDIFKVNLIKDGKQTSLTYRSGILENERILESSDDTNIEILVDHTYKTQLKTISSVKSGKLLEEVFNSTLNSSEDYHLINSYDENGVLYEKQIQTEEGIMKYTYSLNEFDQRTIRIMNNGLLHKEVTYEEDGRKEKVYLDGIYYATIIYSSDNEIIEVIND